jgi:hypothetical protein
MEEKGKTLLLFFIGQQFKFNKRKTSDKSSFLVPIQ